MGEISSVLLFLFLAFLRYHHSLNSARKRELRQHYDRNVLAFTVLGFKKYPHVLIV